MGYYTRDLLAIIGETMHTNMVGARPIRRVSTGWKYDDRVCLKVLGKKKKRKLVKAGCGKGGEIKTLHDMLFCLQYYGFNFKGSHPPHPTAVWGPDQQELSLPLSAASPPAL
jgi:hypothetical protein